MRLDFNQGMASFGELVDQSGTEAASLEAVATRVDGLNTDFTQAEKDGLFVLLPREEPKKSNDASRIKTVRNRLANLGYMLRDSGRPYLDEELKTAIRRFQTEAELDVDGWVGNQTWTALQELVSFESNTNLLRWFKAGKATKPLKRAVGLRLFALGLVETAPASEPSDPTSGMRAFGRMWEMLNLGSMNVAPTLSLEWTERLFDQDGLVERLAQATVPSSDHDLRQIHGFILNAAKIELWLAGYNIRPTGYDLKSFRKAEDKNGFEIFKISSSMTKYLRLKKNMRFYKALLSFWEDQETDREQVKSLTVDFIDTFPQFFQEIATGIEADAVMSASEKQKQIEQFLQDYPEQVPTIWDQVRKLGNRIWDGVRRVWGWLGKLVKSGVKKVITIGRNLSRLIYDYALGAYTVISNVFKSFGAMARFLFNPVVEGSDPKHAVICHDRDFDFKVAVNTSADRQAVEALSRKVRRQSRLFVFSCHVLSLLLSITASVIKSGLTGYVGLVFALVKIRGQLDRFLRLIEEYKEVFIT